MSSKQRKRAAFAHHMKLDRQCRSIRRQHAGDPDFVGVVLSLKIGDLKLGPGALFLGAAEPSTTTGAGA